MRLLFQCLLGSAAGASLGFIRPIWAISAGYGAAMSLQAALALASRETAMDKRAVVHLLLVAAYGVRLVGFLLWRDQLPSFQKRKQAIEQRTSRISLPKRTYMIVGSTFLYWAMFMPALYSSAASSQPTSPLRVAVSNAGLGLAAAALALEGYSDVVQQLHYQRGGAPPCRQGPWRWSRHPNYLGEVLFWWGSWLAGSCAYTGQQDWLAAAVGTLGITGIITFEGRRKGPR